MVQTCFVGLKRWRLNGGVSHLQNFLRLKVGVYDVFFDLLDDLGRDIVLVKVVQRLQEVILHQQFF